MSNKLIILYLSCRSHPFVNIIRHVSKVAKNHCTAKPILISGRRKGGALRKESQKFIDYKEVLVNGGNGGDGQVTFLSENHREFGGSDGGDGGNGGHIIFRATRNLKSLNHLCSVYRATAGENGRSKNCFGKCAEHTVIEVPVGTLIMCSESGSVELTEDGDEHVGARGGAGGHGNHYFQCNNNKAPAFAEFGGEGEVKKLTVELRVMAHAGMVGYPNAGKSTLLRAISRAAPRVASYPFTTLNPHVGMVLYEDLHQLAVADIPGIIPGAHHDKGLGLSFLRHIERCLCLWYVIDVSRADCVEQLEQLRNEVYQYNSDLSSRTSVVVLNKVDVKPNYLHLMDDVRWQDMDNVTTMIPISALKLENIENLLIKFRAIYDQEMLSEERVTGEGT